MFEIQLKARPVSMCSYGGWLTIHATGDLSEARKIFAELTTGMYQELNMVVDIQIVDENGSVVR